MENKITITVEGDQGELVIGALVSWALMKAGIRPAYEGQNRQSWQWLCTDEHTLELKLKELLASGDITFVLREGKPVVEAKP